MTAPTEPLAGPRCVTCGGPLRPQARFCAGCGAPVVVPPPARPGRSGVKLTVAFYVCMLAISGATALYGQLAEDEHGALIAGTVALAALTLAFALPHRDLVAAPSRTAGFSPRGYALIALASVPIVLAVAAYVNGLHAAFRIHVPSELGDLEHRHVAWALGLVVIAPPLMEELAFRGLIYGGLREHLRGSEALLLQAIAFGLVHFSIPSLVTHIPLGLYFGWLRHRSGSLWPGVLAHACHNLGVCLLAWTGIA